MKKVLSIFLALAMLISLIPAVFAADTEAETGIKIVYDFYNADLAALEKDEEFQLKDLSYAASNGFWQYADNYDSAKRQYIQTNTGTGYRAVGGYIYVCAAPTTPKYWLAVKLNVPKQGKYDIKFTTYTTGGAAIAKVTSVNAFMFKADETINIKDLVNNTNGELNTTNISRNTEKEYTIGRKELDAGEYYFVLNPYHTYDSTAAPAVYLCSLTLTEDGTGTALVPMYFPGEVEDIQLEVGESKEVTGTMTHWSDGKEYDGETVTYTGESENDAVAVYENNEIVAKGTGNTTITVKSSDGYFVRDVNVKVVKQDEALTNAFDDAEKVAAPSDYVAPSVDAIEADGIVGKPELQADGSYKITASETNAEGEAFLYWKKAMTTNEKIVSLVREFNYVPESEGRNILVAVYEGDITSTSPKCYNANGQYLPDATPAEADLPSMAGYGKAYKWEQYGDTNVYVAQYEAETPIADIDVTVKGENTSGGGTNLAYGAPVTCKATGANFKCWMKTYGDDNTAKIVSIDAEYTFNAWEDCEVTALYEENVYYTGSKLKIIIDSFTAGDETGVMAEFLGLGNNVVEKGIMFVDSEENKNRIAMTTAGNQFSVIADADGTYTGYVIVEETDGLKLITDGEYENN